MNFDTMLQVQLIREFLDEPSIAVVGVSRKGDIPANHIFKRFREAGYRAFAVNPNAGKIEGETCYHDLGSIPDHPSALFQAGTPEVSEQYAAECRGNGVKIAWMHRGIGKGSYSEKAERQFTENGIKVIGSGCPLMFITPVDPFHKLLRWFRNL